VKTRYLAITPVAIALLLTGCAAGKDGNASSNGAAVSTAAGQSAAGQSMAGMSRAPGQSMAGMTTAAGESMAGRSAAPAAAAPSETAKMVCSDDVRKKVDKVLQLSTPAPVRSTWKDQLYTCTYALPMGPMVLSVKQSASKSDARAYFDALRPQLGTTETLIGLGERAYATKTGIAVVLKDNMTLRVDTTALPAVFGPQQQRRTDLAYEVASDVLGCWTGDE